jgi:predicted O-methyltransferase YrrM
MQSDRSAAIRAVEKAMSVAKRLIGPEWRFRVHHLGRLRWLTKYRLMRKYGAEASWRTRWTYVLIDPEIESFSYELEDETEAISALAAALGRPAEEFLAYAAETHEDPELNRLLWQHVRWRPDVKRRPPLGNRLAWYVLARAFKPELIAETGIYLGLGSLALLRALARNAEEGSKGELISFDVVPSAGLLVREQMRPGWRRVLGDTRDTLPATLQGRRVDMLFQDTPHTEENQRFEFGVALANAGPRLLLLDSSGGYAPALRALCSELGGAYHLVPMRSRAHIHPGAPISFGVFERDQSDG